MLFQIELLKKIGMVLVATGFVFFATSAQATRLSGYNDLVMLYTKGFSEDEQAAFKDTIEKMDQNALNQILKKELNSTFSERQYIFRQSDSTPTRIYHFNQKYTVIGFEKTLHYKGSWVKAAYMLLFENKGPQHLNYTNTYLFWKGKTSVEEYKSISVGDLCEKFSLLSQLENCGEEPIQVAEKDTKKVHKIESQEVSPPKSQTPPPPAEPVRPKAAPKKIEPPKPSKDLASTGKKEEKIPEKIMPSGSTLDLRLSAMDSQIRSLNMEMGRKADRAHTHNGKDITSGIVKESFIDAAVARDRELMNVPGKVTYSDVDNTYVNSLENRIMELENTVQRLTALLEGVSRDKNNLVFKGVNVQVVNGTGTTNGAVNGLGNLIVGYNQPRDGADEIERTGSHNIIVGDGHDYKSYGGLVAGLSNTISGAYSSVSGGLRNVASGDYSAVSGGHFKSAEGLYSLSQPDAGMPETEEEESRACFIDALNWKF